MDGADSAYLPLWRGYLDVSCRCRCYDWTALCRGRCVEYLGFLCALYRCWCDCNWWYYFSYQIASFNSDDISRFYEEHERQQKYQQCKNRAGFTTEYCANWYRNYDTGYLAGTGNSGESAWRCDYCNLWIFLCNRIFAYGRSDWKLQQPGLWYGDCNTFDCNLCD